MAALFDVLRNLWLSDNLPQASIVESRDILQSDKEIMDFITSATIQYSSVSAENNTDIYRAELGSNKKGDATKVINIDQIRELQSNLSATASISPYKFAIILDADAMNINASNSMLKILEDTPKNSFIFLVTKHIDNLIPTIRSRAIVIFKVNGVLTDSETIFGKEIYNILNPEVRYEDKALLIEDMLGSKKVTEEDLIIILTNHLTKISKGIITEENQEIMNYIDRKNINPVSLHFFAEEAIFLLNSVPSSSLDLRQILLLLISKFALL